MVSLITLSLICLVTLYLLQQCSAILSHLFLPNILSLFLSLSVCLSSVGFMIRFQALYGHWHEGNLLAASTTHVFPGSDLCIACCRSVAQFTVNNMNKNVLLAVIGSSVSILNEMKKPVCSIQKKLLFG